MADYGYSPLDRATKSIRLLQFEPPPPGSDVICCSLDTYDLDSCPPFAALSYAWGKEDSSPQRDIFLDWTPFSVRQNLHGALCTIRDYENIDQLWIKTCTALSDYTSRQTDWSELMVALKEYTPKKERWQMVLRKVLHTTAIMDRDRKNDDVQCLEAFWGIFQTMVEYNDEVPLVEDGHAPAEWKHRYYWIDAICINQQDDRERGHQVNFMGDIYRRAECVLAWLGPATAASDLEMHAITRAMQSHATKGRPGLLDRSLEDIGERPYWRRLWTAQEFILARAVLLICGRWKTPAPYETFLSSLGQPAAVTGPMFHRLGSRHWWMQAGTVSLDMLVWQFSSAQCSDPRDRVYALLSLVRDHDLTLPRLEPDYTITERQLYHRSLAHLTTGNSVLRTWHWDSKSFRADLRKAVSVPLDQSFNGRVLRAMITKYAGIIWPHSKESHGGLLENQRFFESMLFKHSYMSRAYLRAALNIPEDESVMKHDLVYQITGVDELRMVSDPRLEPHRTLLENLCSKYSYHAQQPKTWSYGSKDLREVYQEIVDFFFDFPKAEDPGTWVNFDEMLRTELGLDVHTGGDMCNE